MYEYRKKVEPEISMPKETDNFPRGKTSERFNLPDLADSFFSILKNIKLEDIILIALILIVLKSEKTDNLLVLALIYLLIG